MTWVTIGRRFVNVDTDRDVEVGISIDIGIDRYLDSWIIGGHQKLTPVKIGGLCKILIDRPL